MIGVYLKHLRSLFFYQAKNNGNTKADTILFLQLFKIWIDWLLYRKKSYIIVRHSISIKIEMSFFYRCKNNLDSDKSFDIWSCVKIYRCILLFHILILYAVTKNNWSKSTMRSPCPQTISSQKYQVGRPSYKELTHRKYEKSYDHHMIFPIKS